MPMSNNMAKNAMNVNLSTRIDAIIRTAYKTPESVRSIKFFTSNEFCSEYKNNQIFYIYQPIGDLIKRYERLNCLFHASTIVP